MKPIHPERAATWPLDRDTREQQSQQFGSARFGRTSCASRPRIPHKVPGNSFNATSLEATHAIPSQVSFRSLHHFGRRIH